MEEAGLAVDFYEVRFYLNIDQLGESLINWLINRRHYNQIYYYTYEFDYPLGNKLFHLDG